MHEPSSSSTQAIPATGACRNGFGCHGTLRSIASDENEDPHDPSSSCRGRIQHEGAYCIDIQTQLQAVKSALAKAEDEIIKPHADSCVAEAIASGDAEAQRTKFSELVDLFAKAKR